ncbi:MAG: tetratricopeptide repeat protein [Terracidiphilus sp.]
MSRPLQNGSTLMAITVLAISMFIPAASQSVNGDPFQTLLKQGFALHQQARFADAIPVLERARRLQPDDYFANLLLGIDLLRSGKTAEALPRLEMAARIKPGEEFPEDYLGEAEASLGRYAQAAEAYHRAIERGHGSEQALESWAAFALERFRQIGEKLRATDTGVATVRRLVAAAAKPESSLACNGSIPSLERRLALEPVDFGTNQQMETAYALSICYALEAGNAAKQLQESTEDAAALYRLRGDILLRLKGDATSAETDYRQALALRPDDPALLERLAAAQYTSGNNDGAQKSALAALAIDPHRREALHTMALVSMNGRDYEQALPWLRKLATESPGDLSVQVELGRALAQTGHPDEALKALAPALAAGYPDEKGALHSLESRVLREQGREAEAAKAAAEARRLSDAFQARDHLSEKKDSNANQ